MPSFDIVSRLELAEVDNALAGLARELATRFDFKGSKSAVTREDLVLTILADDEMKLRQLEELLKGHLARRKVDPAALEFKPAERASGQMLRQTVTLKQGIAADMAKNIVRAIKDSKLKVQAPSRAMNCGSTARSATICKPRSNSCAASRSRSRCSM